MTEQDERFEINWVQVSASALAAVSSAVLLSTVGVAGTIIGAAVGSIFATVGSAVYSHYLRVSRERVARAQATALERVTRARASVTGAAADVRPGRSTHTQRLRARREVEQAGDELDHAERELQDVEETERPGWREILAGLPWRRIAVITGAVFVAAMVVIVAFELIAGRPVSSYTGGTSSHSGTSIPGFGTAKSHTTPTPSPSPSQAPSPVGPAATPSGTASGSAVPSPSPTPGGTPTTVVPSPTTTPLVPTPTQGQTPAG
jgi:hypothetical protein